MPPDFSRQFSASASDGTGSGVADVEFKLDGANLGTEDTVAPYQVSWDTRTASEGSHTLTAVARDRAGNLTTSATITVTVDNIISSTFPNILIGDVSDGWDRNKTDGDSDSALTFPLRTSLDRYARLTGPAQGNLDFFVAPSKFRGNLSRFYGGKLKFDLRLNHDSRKDRASGNPIVRVVSSSGGTMELRNTSRWSAIRNSVVC